ncbi:MAG: ABC transporter permease subunit [Thermoguttaceae bacterium]
MISLFGTIGLSGQAAPWFIAAPPWVTSWLTPLWISGLGVLAGLLFLALIWGVVALFSRPAAAEVPRAIREGPLSWIFVVACLWAGFGLASTAVVREPGELLASLGRLPFTGTRTWDFDIGAEDAQREIAVSYRRDELRRLELKSDVDLTIRASADPDTDRYAKIDVTAEEEVSWGAQKAARSTPDEISSLYVWNRSGTPGKLHVVVGTAPRHAEVLTAAITAVALVGLFLLYFLQRLLMPKLAAISLTTTKSELAQPIFLICLALGIFLLILFIFLPYQTLDEEIKMLKDSGLTLIRVLAIVVALWAASTSVAAEIEGRTALTVLSKPISRWQFILGKFSGITWTVVVLFVVLGCVFLLTVAYKPIHDSREMTEDMPSWQICHLEMVGAVPGLVLGLMETVVLAALSVAISTRLSLLGNFSICSSVYVLGHLTPLIVKSSLGQLEPVAFVGQLLATILPVLENFDIQPAIAGGRPVPYEYLCMSLVYCMLYSTVAMLLALVLFEDRDLA